MNQFSPTLYSHYVLWLDTANSLLHALYAEITILVPIFFFFFSYLKLLDEQINITSHTKNI